MKNIKIHPALYYFISVVFLELTMKVILGDKFINTGLLYTLIFSIPIIILLTLITKMFKSKTNRIISIITMLIMTIYFEVQYVFYTLFSVPFSFSTIGLADQALDFVSIIKDTLLAHWPIIILLFVPFILLIIFRRKIDYSRYSKASLLTIFILFITSYLSTFLCLIPNHDQPGSAKKLYFNIDDQLAIIDKFGMLTYTKIDIKRQIFNYEPELIFESEIPIPNGNNDPEEIVYEPNIIDVDFASLKSDNKSINTLNKYMANTTPSLKNEYTGMFKGKNLIFILAEGFNEVAVDEVRTPTLYKMVNGGFVFNNFYSPVFLSTTGGEFQAATGLIPTQEILKIWKEDQPKISYALGNVFNKEGYDVQSYHNWTYRYYKRHLTMKTLGYEHYIGCGNGLEEKMSCKWLPKDTDMVNVTTPNYLGKDGNFMTYYITVSGHSPYNVNDNIGKMHFDQVKDLEYGTSVKYYLAAQIELDKMLEELIKKLEESGQLDDTVIALVGDHYPYTLSIDEMNEVSSYKKDLTVEVNRSNFILWNNAMEEPIQVDKVGSQIDVLPTLLNLFGIEYESRMIMGKDILSNSEGIAIFSDRSWTTDYGTYKSGSKTFIPKEGKTLDNQAEYIKRINNKVSNYFSISKLIIEHDYYKYILGSE